MKAIGDKVIVKALQKKDTTESGIILHETAQKPPNEGEVLSVGEDVKFVKKGDHIIFSPYDYDEIEEKEVFVMSEYSVWAVVKS